MFGESHPLLEHNIISLCNSSAILVFPDFKSSKLVLPCVLFSIGGQPSNASPISCRLWLSFSDEPAEFWRFLLSLSWILQLNRDDTDLIASWSDDERGTSSGGTYLSIKTETAAVVNAKRVPTLTCMNNIYSYIRIRLQQQDNNRDLSHYKSYCYKKISITCIYW